MINLVCTEQWAKIGAEQGFMQGSGEEVRVQIDTSKDTAREGSNPPTFATITPDQVGYQYGQPPLVIYYVIDRMRGRYAIIDRGVAGQTHLSGGPCQIDPHPDPKF
jgi:hypothetical protein